MSPRYVNILLIMTWTRDWSPSNSRSVVDESSNSPSSTETTARFQSWRHLVEPRMQSTTVHMDWYQNDRGDQVLGVEDDALRFIFDMIETDSSSAETSVELLDSVCQNWDSSVPILEVITDHGSEFVNMHQDDRPCLDHVTPPE